MNCNHPNIRRRILLGGGALSFVCLTIGSVHAETDIELDEVTLRRYGARLDGITDDSDAIQKAIDIVVQRSSLDGHPAVAIILPAGRVLLKKALYTHGADFLLRGVGQDLTVVEMAQGGNGVIIHGESSSEAIGYLELANLSIVDGNSEGSGAAAIVSYHAPNAMQPAMTWQNIAFRKWRTAAKITNCPRNWHCENVTVYGPDFHIQSGAAFEISSIGPGGCYSYNFINVFIANYTWGWLYNIQSPLEGQRFIACTCYNGWGMVRAVVKQSAAMSVGDEAYQSLLWSFDECDWQGLGYALDMTGCRNIRVTGGFYIANLNSSSLKIPYNRFRRRYFSFNNCRDIVASGVELDVLAHTEDSLSLVYIGPSTRNIRFRDTIIASYAPIYAIWEIDGDIQKLNFQKSGTIYNKFIGKSEIVLLKNQK